MCWNRCRITLGSALAAFCFTGCATITRHVEIPLGEWHGEGIFAYQVLTTQPAASQPAFAGRSLLSRRYPTHLWIHRGSPTEPETYRLEIRSERGSLPGMDRGDETRLRIELTRFQEGPLSERAAGMSGSDSPGTRVRAAGTNVSVYQVTGFRFSSDGKEWSDLLSAAFATAVCTRHDDIRTLNILYPADGLFHDVLTFRGQSVEKVGIFADDNRLVQWSERLSRR